MFGIGMSEMVIILAVALLVFGPDKLPTIAKQLAKGLKEIRKAGDDLRSSVNFDLDDDRPQRPRPIAPPKQPEPPPNIPGSALADNLPSTPAAPASNDPVDDGANVPPRPLGEIWPKPADGAVAQGEAEPAEKVP